MTDASSVPLLPVFVSIAVGEFQRVNEIVKRSGEFVEAQQRVADGDLDFVYDEMEVELAKVSREFDIASLLPGMTRLSVTGESDEIEA